MSTLVYEAAVGHSLRPHAHSASGLPGLMAITQDTSSTQILQYVQYLVFYSCPLELVGMGKWDAPLSAGVCFKSCWVAG